jgi:SagB-type dehydrogenase family enzyme
MPPIAEEVSGDCAALMAGGPGDDDDPIGSVYHGGCLRSGHSIIRRRTTGTVSDEDLIRKRRSTRNYDTEVAIGFDAFSTLVDRASRGVATDCLASNALPLHDQYLIVNRVEGLETGVYRVHPDRQAIELVRPGTFRAEAQRLAVDQAYAGDAHVNSYYLADLDPVLAHYGNRGYRVAQLEAALYGSRLHLATHALGLGAVGSTSLDEEVVEFFTPGNADASYLFVVVFGKRRRRTPASG